MIRQGEVRHLEYGGTVFTVIVLSSDSYNAVYPPLIAPIKQRGLPDLPPAFVALHDADPFKGIVDMTEMTSSGGGHMASETLGVVIGDTMGRIRQALMEIVED